MKHLLKPKSLQCARCNQLMSGKHTTQCPEVKLCDDIAKRVQSGQLDLVDGVWVSLKPEQESMKQMDDAVSSLVEFMEAIVPELSPEANDELTNEDIDLLNRINKFPIASHIVSELDLPVGQLVSLHKLKRLNYVNLFGGSTDQVIRYHYKVTNKGKEFLKPKPVTLNAEQTAVLLSIATDEDPWTVHDVTELQVYEEMKYIYELGLVRIKNRAHVLTEAGLNHVNKILALTV